MVFYKIETAVFNQFFLLTCDKMLVKKCRTPELLTRLKAVSFWRECVSYSACRSQALCLSEQGCTSCTMLRTDGIFVDGGRLCRTFELRPIEVAYFPPLTRFRREMTGVEPNRGGAARAEPDMQGALGFLAYAGPSLE